jgi:type IV pilus assembly protein PilQ
MKMTRNPKEHRETKTSSMRSNAMRWKLALTMCLSLCALLLASPALAQSKDARLNRISSFDVVEKDEGTYVRIDGSATPTFSVFKLTAPLRLFIDVSNSELAGEARTERVNNGVISQVALIEFKDNVQSVTRVIIGFDTAAHYDVRTEGDDVVVFVDGKDRNDNSNNVAAIKKELDEREAKLAALEKTYRDRLESQSDQVSDAKRQLESTKRDLASTEKELDGLRAELERARGEERNRIEQKLAKKNRDVSNLRAEVESRQKRLDELNAAVARLEKERDSERARVAELTRKAEKAERERDEALRLARAKEAEEAKARARAASLEKSLESTRGQLDDVAATKDKLSGEVASLRSTIEQRNAEVTRRQKELETARAEQARLEKQLASLRQAAAAGDDASAARVRQIETERSELNRKLQARADELERARNQADQTKSQLARLQGTLESKDGEIARLKKELDAARQARKREERVAAAAEQERLAAVKEAVQREKQRVAALEQSRQAEQDALRELRAEREAEKARLDSLAALTRKQEARLATLKSELEQARRANAAANAQIAAKTSKPAARAVPVDPANTIRGISLETVDGRSRVVVELDRPGAFETMPNGDSRAVMILNDVELPRELQKTLTSGNEGGAVRFVSSFSDRQGQVRVEAELGKQAKEVIRQEGNTLVWEFAPTAVPQRQVAAVAAEQTRPQMGESFTAAPPGYPMVVADPTSVSTVPGMSRKRVTLDLREADIQNVLRLIAKEGGVNIVSGDGVGGSVTIRLRSVPLDEVFLTVLQSQQLGFERRGNVIRVAPQKTLVEEQNARAEARRAASQNQPTEVFLIPVNYAQARPMAQQVSGLLSPRGNVSVDERTNTLVVRDVATNLNTIRQLVESLDSQVPQVLIEARIVETNDTFNREFGIQWGGDVSFSQANGNPTGLIFPSVLGLAGGATDGQTPVEGTSANPNFAVNLPAAAGTGSGGALGLTLGSVGGAVNLNLRLSALEEQGSAKIVSAPKIMALDNQTANISQGTSIPISVVSAAGVQTVFVDATLELDVTPTVTPDGNIRLRIAATKNEPDFQNTGARGDPTIIRRAAETELLIRDGDTTVIGGIYTRNTGTSASGVPFLKDIPILGYFFRTSSSSERRTELLIFITPRIVNRAESIGNAATGAVE